MAARRRGRNELAVKRSLNGITAVSPAHEALAQSALTLARTLDEGAGLATAAVARELRATLEALTKGGSDDNGDAVAKLLTRLSTPLGDAPASSASDVRPKRRRDR